MENKSMCIGCNIHKVVNEKEYEYLFQLIVNNNENYIKIHYENNRTYVIERESYFFGYNNRVSMTNFKEWIDDPHERHYKNLNVCLKNFVHEYEHENNNCDLTLKECLSNIYDNYNKIKNSEHHKLCKKCVLLLKITGTLLLTCYGIEDMNKEYYYYEFFCCIRCNNPHRDRFQFHLSKNETGEYKIGNRNKYIDYADDDIQYKYKIYGADNCQNFTVCRTCFDEIADINTTKYTQSYYYNQTIHTNKIICSSCNFKQKYPLDDNRSHEYTFIGSFLRVLSDTNFTHIVLLDNQKYNLIPTKRKYDTDYRIKLDKVKFSKNLCSKLKINYLNNNMNFLLDFLPKEICSIILEFYVLYYDLCDNCVSNELINYE